jgi:hypothetical protein
MARSITLAIVQSFALAASQIAFTPHVDAAESEFVFRIPPGWIDLARPGTRPPRGTPQHVLDIAHSEGIRVYAIDPKHLTPNGAAVNLNVVEQPGTERITDRTMKRCAVEVVDQFKKMGFTARVLGEPAIRDMGGVSIGVLDVALEIQGNTCRARHYIIPGKAHMAVMTYFAPEALFVRYEPLFDLSAMATGGAYEAPKTVDFGRAARAGLLGGFAGAIVAWFAYREQEKKKNAAAALPNPYSCWHCPICKRRHAATTLQCRCGAAKADRM